MLTIQHLARLDIMLAALGAIGCPLHAAEAVTADPVIAPLVKRLAVQAERLASGSSLLKTVKA